MTKSQFLKLSTLLSFMAPLLAFGALDEALQTKPEWASVKQVFVPAGFDNNDNAQVIVSGFLPNLCYKAPTAKVSVTGQSIFISVKVLVDPTKQQCLQMIVPFLEPVSLGALPAGEYKIFVNPTSSSYVSSKINIENVSLDQPVDNYVYANVSAIEKVQGTRKVKLKGENPSTCVTLDRVEFQSNKKDTYAVLPIMKKVSDICAQMMVPFEYEAEVPNELKGAEDVLLHVRVMNGKSVNETVKN